MRVVVLLLLFLTVMAAGQAIVYKDAFTRDPNITLDYNKVPWVLRGVTPQLEKPRQLVYDTVVLDDPVRLDPRTCPGELAICYQIREHTFGGEITYGRNYTHAGSYVLPDRRVKFRYCVGNDTQCVRESTACFCPQEKVPKAPFLFGKNSDCTDDAHLCRNSYGSFVLCGPNLTACQETYTECGCGRWASCRADGNNVCINARKELYNCQGTMADCLSRYDTCFCGTEMLKFQSPCSERRHACERGDEEITCAGKFTDCALRFDSCTCGVPGE